MQQIRIGVLAVGMVVGVATAAGAQQAAPWNDRVFANISFGVSVGTEGVSRTQAFDLYGEQGSIRTESEVGSGPLVDVVVGGRLRGPFGAAIGLMFRNKDRDATIDASIPDPIVFDQPRTLTQQVGDLTHGETWITPMFVWHRPLTEFLEGLEAMVMAGPAIVRVEHAQVGNEFSITETSGGPAVGVSTSTVNKTGVGFSIGGDVRYLLTPTLGVGGFLRFARASVDVADDVSLDVGGLHLGVGVRIRY